MNLKLAMAISLAAACVQAHAETTTTATPATQGQATMTQSAAMDPATKNKHDGEAFLNVNKTKPEVVTLKDGLQYKIIKAGKGPKPTANDTVTVDYAGKFVDGTEFDSSAKHGGPVNFMVGQVIPGWVEALQMMPVGSTWEIYIPAELAYGSTDAPQAIGPNKALIFKVSLIDIKKS
jgi:FKBP-type peptidyl-prolyl cis-trans isomerase FklB